MSYTNCPVCRRVKAHDALVCTACWESVDQDTRGRHERLKSEADGHPLESERGAAYGRFCDHGRAIVEQLKETRSAGKPFGYDVEIRCMNEPRYRTFHWQGSEATARRKARLQSTFIEIVSMQPLTRAEWIRAYGIGRM